LALFLALGKPVWSVRSFDLVPPVHGSPY
jgi:hypothetical protein